MTLNGYCNNDVAVVERNSSVFEAARKMRESHVGDVVVVDHDGASDGGVGVPRPVGILTDRDIVVGVVALEIPLDTIHVEDVMTPALVTVNRNAGVYETIHLMETYGVRRLPIVDDEGGLCGIVSSGDLLELLGEEILSLSKLPSRQKLKEQEIRL